MFRLRVFFALSIFLITGLHCTRPSKPVSTVKKQNTTTTDKKRNIAVAKDKKLKLSDVGIDGRALDRSVDPCDDFYTFTCGQWQKRTKIPADKARWVRSFSVINDENERYLKNLLEKLSTTAQSPDEKKLGSFFQECMNESRIDKEKMLPLSDQLSLIRKTKDLESLLKTIISLHKQQIWVFFELEAEQNPGDATEYIAYLDQAGLGLPDQSYYVRNDEKAKAIQKAYKEHVAKMLRLSGYSEKGARRAATTIYRIEETLAKTSLTRTERRNPKLLFNKRSVKKLNILAKQIRWKTYFDAFGLHIKELNIVAPKFIKTVNTLISKTNIRDIRHYLAWHLLDNYAHTLPKVFVDEAFNMKKLLTGQKEQAKRWKRCIAATDSALGELLGQAYIKDRFSKQSKTMVTTMVESIRSVFATVLNNLSWMDKETQDQAHIKLKKMAFLIGYPDKWKTYPFKTDGHYAENVRLANEAELKRKLSRIGKAVDPNEWEMTPATVNAYYHPQKNHMVFPAGILQPPFFNPKAALAVNMGAMGMVVGHELTHGFDDEGSQYDAEGNLRNWWSKKVRSDFETRTQCVVDQYASYQPLPGVKLNGKLTLGENIADGGGVKLAYLAYKKMRKGKKELKVEGFTEDQLFFLSVGQIWCSKQKEALTRLRAKIDPHSPPRFRVNGSLANSEDFAKAFSCKAPSRKRCDVW